MLNVTGQLTPRRIKSKRRPSRGPSLPVPNTPFPTRTACWVKPWYRLLASIVLGAEDPALPICGRDSELGASERHGPARYVACYSNANDRPGQHNSRLMQMHKPLSQIVRCGEPSKTSMSALVRRQNTDRPLNRTQSSRPSPRADAANACNVFIMSRTRILKGTTIPFEGSTNHQVLISN